MKRLLLVLSLLGMMTAFFGCSNDPQTTGPAVGQDTPGTLVQRPEFIDNRPDAVKAAFTKLGTPIESSDRVVADGFSAADPNPTPAHKYAYVIGISDYDGTANDLNFCDDDARDVIAFLNSQGFTVRSDIDYSASAANIQAGLIWLRDAAVPGDEVAFFYSGHGTKVRPSGGSSIISRDLYYLTHAYVMGYLNAANCTKKTINLDACVIGDFHADCKTGTVLSTASVSKYSYDAPDLQNGAWT
ncbi:MAG TPA: caspase family protein, partial [candidate division Zixibacteria bacterium]|nr:caspase family protein [candidate division Zixibacteria bacterium]